jgi:hypothetical protein
MSAKHQHAVLEVVELLTDSGRWPAGTVGTIVESDQERVLVEIGDDRGHGIDFVSLPHNAVGSRQVDNSRAAS